MSQAATAGFAPIAPGRPAILIAGIGNIFFGDDGFGVEVVRRLHELAWPAGVVVKDFGIRGLDLAYALQDGYDRVILVDAIRRGGPAGTLHLLEIDPDTAEAPGELQMHHLDPVQVFRLVRQMGGRLPRIHLVGCEPMTLASSEGELISLSEPVRQAVPRAVDLIGAVINNLEPS